MSRIKVAILGSGNIGIDLLVKIMRAGSRLEITALAGIDPASEGLAFANRAGIATTSSGIDGLRALPVYPDIRIVFDATSAGAHQRHDAILRADGKRIIDLTPAHIGPFVVPVANLDDHLDAPNINMVTCGGQATIPVVRAISDVVSVHYGEIVASIASRSAGPGTRANIDEFTQTTSAAIESIGRARRGKAIIILNPADPPLVMRNTVLTLSEEGDRGRIRESIAAMSEKVAAYVPGYRLKQEVQFESVGNNAPLKVPRIGDVSGLKTTVFLEVTGAGHHLPAFAGNLDIMTSAARAAGERLAQHILGSQP